MDHKNDTKNFIFFFFKKGVVVWHSRKKLNLALFNHIPERLWRLNSYYQVLTKRSFKSDGRNHSSLISDNSEENSVISAGEEASEKVLRQRVIK